MPHLFGHQIGPHQTIHTEHLLTLLRCCELSGEGRSIPRSPSATARGSRAGRRRWRRRPPGRTRRRRSMRRGRRSRNPESYVQEIDSGRGAMLYYDWLYSRNREIGKTLSKTKEEGKTIEYPYLSPNMHMKNLNIYIRFPLYLYE